jgi:Tubulin-tyrosine ligase family
MFQNAEIQRKMNMTEEELRNFQMWNFTKLGDYLQKEEALPEKYLRQPEGGRKWIKEVLESQLISGLTHLVTIIDEGLNKASGFYQIFGVDFIMDDSFNLWLVECNTGPALVGTSKEKYDLMYGLVRDMFEIEFGLLRSRLKRVMKILNEISIEIYNETIKVETGLGNQKMIERKIQSYFTKERKKVLMERLKNANKDKFEPEWVPSENNGWVNIVDFGQNDRSKTYHPSFNTTCAPK